MSGEVSVPSTFFDRARREAERYGDDPWIFLRELVQNSRDAGAGTIAFSAERSDSTETVVCDDDGCGMTRADVGRYLLRLYASRKSEDAPDAERDEDAVGRFGVGFWSVLRFGPALIRVDSRTSTGALGLEVDCVRQTIREVPTDRTTSGTRVTLVRPARELEDQRSFLGLVADRLQKYAGTVKGVSGRPAPELTLAGKPLNRTLAPRGFIAERIRGRGFDGVIALADRPTIRLYAHGLLVKEVASLEELLPRRGARGISAAPGLYPRAEINADGLEVLLDRQAVVEDKLLEMIVATCDRRLGRLRRRLLDRLAPLPILQRLFLALRDPYRLAAVGLMVLLLSTSAGLGYVIVQLSDRATLSTQRRAPVTSSRRIEDALLPGAGPVIDTPEGPVEAASPWDIRYVGAGRPFIKLMTQGRYHEEKGLLSDPIRLVGRYAGEQDRHDGKAFELFVGISGDHHRMILPVPVGHRLVQGSLTLDGEPLGILGATRHDEPVALDLAEGGKRLRYRTVPAQRAEPPGLIDAPPRGSLPDDLWDLVIDVEDLSSPREKVRRTEAFIKDRIRYTTTGQDADRFASFRNVWLEQVMDYGAGDCDVMNGLNVLTLRAAGVHARLGVGFVGESGRVAPDLHAWTEYWDGERWRMVDISPPRYVPRPPDLAAVTSSGRPAVDRAGPALTPGFIPTDEDPVVPLPAGDAPAPPVAPSTGSTLARVALGLLLLGALAAFSVAVFLLVRERRKRRHDDDADDQVAVALLEHLLRDGSGADPLHLRHRPIFRTLGGKRISLARLEALARRGRLVAAHSSNPLLSALARNVPVLDRADPRVERFRRRLRELIMLEDIVELLKDAGTHAALEDAGRRLGELDDGVRVHALADSAEIREVALPVRDGARVQPRHLLVGLRDPVVRDALALWDHDRALARFRLFARILDRTTLYLEVKESLLSGLAREAL